MIKYSRLTSNETLNDTEEDKYAKKVSNFSSSSHSNISLSNTNSNSYHKYAKPQQLHKNTGILLTFFNNNKEQLDFVRCLCAIMLIALTFYLLMLFAFGIKSEEVAEAACSGHLCQDKVCAEMKEGRIAGNLCMDLCFTRSIEIPDCSELVIRNNMTYKFYSVNGYDSSFICSFNSKKYSSLNNPIGKNDFKQMLIDLIQRRLSYLPLIEEQLEHIYHMADANKDHKLSYAEASTIWTLMNNKHSFYILLLNNKAYIPKIKSSCGNLLETEKITNKLVMKDSSFTLAKSWPKLKWDYKCKIALGILEFFLDAISFNPNDEFGKETLYLCAPIESSFGFTFFNEAKLIEYENLLTGKELEEKLSDRKCNTDTDCVYTTQCASKCNTTTQKCTYQLVQPQIIDMCRFIKENLVTESNKLSFMPLIDKCEQLKSVYLSPDIAYKKNEMPLSYEKHKIYLEQSSYWNSSLQYAEVSRDLHALMFDLIRLSRDPVKPKKKTTQHS